MKKIIHNRREKICVKTLLLKLKKVEEKKQKIAEMQHWRACKRVNIAVDPVYLLTH